MRPIKKKLIPPILKEIRARIYEPSDNAEDIIPKPKNAYKQYIDNIYTRQNSEKIDPKPILQEALASEQGFVCCYCMRAISLDKMIIEHFKPEGLYNGQLAKDISPENKNNLTTPHAENDVLKDLTIDYDNLLAACEHDSNKQCDNKKSGYELKYLPNPASLNIKDFEQKCKIFYTDRGAIQSHNTGINEEIGGKLSEDKETVYSEGKLNLNNKKLILARCAAWAVAKNIFFNSINLKDDRHWIDELKKRSKSAVPTLQSLIDRYEQRRKDNSFYPFYGYVLYELNKLLRKITA